MKGRGRFSLLNLLAALLNVPLALLLAASYLADVVSPGKVVFFAFAGLMYPYLLALNLCFVVYWLVQRHRLFLLSLLTILAGFSSLMRYYQYGGNLDPAPSDVPVWKLMSYNVQLFGRYHLDSAGDKSLHTEYRDSIMKIIASEHPDILCLQESSHQLNSFPTLKMLHGSVPDLKYSHPYWKGDPARYNGNMILSRFPIVNAGAVGFSTLLDNRSAMFADIIVPTNDTVRLYNIHLQSVQFQKEDYDFAQQVTTAGGAEQEEEFSTGSKRLFGKLRAAYQIRCIQVDSIVKHIDQSPYPVIVCGDFNDTPWSYTYRRFKKRLKDAQVHSGRGRGNTFILNRILKFRIDYLFYSPIFDNYEHTVIRKSASDHYPVYSYFRIRSSSSSDSSNGLPAVMSN